MFPPQNLSCKELMPVGLSGTSFSETSIQKNFWIQENVFKNVTYKMLAILFRKNMLRAIISMQLTPIDS